MKVLLVNGSPNEKGCTNRALEEVKSELVKNGLEAEIFWLGKSAMQGCIACGKCRILKKCVFEDKVNEFAKTAESADGFVFGSPVYYSGASGSIVPFMNRLFYSHGKEFKYKAAATVVSCRRGGATMTFAELNQHYLMNNMFVVGSQYWNQVHGFTAEDVEKDEEGLQTMRTLARNTAWLLKNIEAGKKAGVALPEHERHIQTDFIR